MIAAINMRRQRGSPRALLFYANSHRHERQQETERKSEGERVRSGDGEAEKRKSCNNLQNVPSPKWENV